jgi:undecaprenyl-diphosphatase
MRHLSCGTRWPTRESLLLVLALGCGAILAALTAQATQGKYLMLDATVRTMVAAWQHPLLVSMMQTVTSLGGDAWLVPPIGFVLVLVWGASGGRAALLWSGHALTSGLLFQGLRLMVGRPRPIELAYGYPSGHTAAVLAVYGLLIYLLWPRLRAFQVWRAVTCGGLLLIIVGVGFSRLYLQKHWLSDVLGAYVAGGLYLTTSTWLLERRRARLRANIRL